MNNDLVPLLAQRFIQRRDVKAVQLAFNDGKVIYTPDRELKNIGSHAPQGFLGRHLLAHLDGTATYGHYLLDNDSMCRLFTFDIDLRVSEEKFTGSYVPMTPFRDAMLESEWEAENQAVEINPRTAWLDRAHPGRQWLKLQMGVLARKLVSAIQTELNIPCAAAYSGNKGIHVYGFTGPRPAGDVRDFGTYVLDSTHEWDLEKGNSQYKHRLDDPYLGFPNFSLELYPKQDSLDGKDLGNLIRLPLGRNLKNPKDPTFFIDLTTPPGVLMPHPDPLRLLTVGDPYE